jgi:hypothetical protein
MSSFFVSGETSDHTITSPTGEEATVTLRELNAGDMATIQDTVRVTSEGDEVSPELRIGAMKLAMVTAAVVSWTLEVPATPNSIRALDSTVFEAIFKIVNGGTGTPLGKQSSNGKPTNLPTEALSVTP